VSNQHEIARSRTSSKPMTVLQTNNEEPI